MSDLSGSGEPTPSRFVTSLARNPALVVVVTFAVSAAVTGALLAFGLDLNAVAVVTTLATVWGLDLALVIYLLTARDTDKLLAHIDALQDQLSAALDSPGADAEVIDTESDEQPANVPTTAAGKPADVPPTATPERPTEAPTAPTDTPERSADVPPEPSVPQRPAATPALTGRVPDAYLAALLAQAGLGASDIRRAWTPHPHGNGPWVIEDNQGGRWSVFQTRGRRPTVISLGSRDQSRGNRHEASQRLRAERLAARADRHTPNA